MAVGRHQIPHECLVSDLASNCDQARSYIVTDGLFFGDLTTGGGSVRGLVAYYDSAWHWIGAPNELRLWPGMGWVQSTGTATLVQPSAALAYWKFTDNGAVNTIEVTFPMPDYWAGRTIATVESTWATSGTSTVNMVIRHIVYDYVVGTDLASGLGTLVDNSGAVAITPVGTADSMSRVDYAAGGTFSAGADLMRVLFQRRTSDAGDTNTEDLRLYGMRIVVA